MGGGTSPPSCERHFAFFCLCKVLLEWSFNSPTLLDGVCG